MATVTGYVLTADDVVEYVTVNFYPLSTPLAEAGGKVITSRKLHLKTSSTDGTFSIDLEAGDYKVEYRSFPVVSFNIAVPTGSGTYTINSITTSALTYTYTIPPDALGVFKADKITLTEGVLSGTVTGLALGFIPNSVHLTFQGDANIFATLTGTPTADGFSYILSGPTDSTNKTLHYICVP